MVIHNLSVSSSPIDNNIFYWVAVNHLFVWPSGCLVFLIVGYCSHMHVIKKKKRFSLAFQWRTVGRGGLAIWQHHGTLAGGGGGTSIIDGGGTCRWTGYDFPVITIDTGYLNRPNWLPAGYSVYHRVAPSPQCLWQDRDLGTSDGACGTAMFMTGSRSRHQWRCVRDATDFLWMYDDTQQK